MGLAIGLIILSVIILFLISAVLYVKLGLFKKLFHDILGWHEPTKSFYFDGCNTHSTCKYCGKEIMKDSQGNWF